MINAVFTPSPLQVAHAKRVLAAFEQSQGGACVVEGKMIDLPVVTAARHTLQIGHLKGPADSLETETIPGNST